MSIEDDIARADEPAYVAELEQRLWAEQLVKESKERKAELERLQGEVLALKGAHTAECRRLYDEVAKLVEKNTLQRQTIDRFGKEQVQLVRALRALLNLLCSEKYAKVQRQFGGEVFRAIQEADEVCRLCEVPFG